MTCLQGLFKQGKVYIIDGLEWLEEELYQFPLSRHDDGLDALCNVVKVATPDLQSEDDIEAATAGRLENLPRSAGIFDGLRREPTWDTL